MMVTAVSLVALAALSTTPGRPARIDDCQRCSLDAMCAPHTSDEARLLPGYRQRFAGEDEAGRVGVLGLMGRLNSAHSNAPSLAASKAIAVGLADPSSRVRGEAIRLLWQGGHPVVVEREFPIRLEAVADRIPEMGEDFKRRLKDCGKLKLESMDDGDPLTFGLELYLSGSVLRLELQQAELIKTLGIRGPELPDETPEAKKSRKRIESMARWSDRKLQAASDDAQARIALGDDFSDALAGLTSITELAEGISRNPSDRGRRALLHAYRECVERFPSHQRPLAQALARIGTRDCVEALIDSFDHTRPRGRRSRELLGVVDVADPAGRDWVVEVHGLLTDFASSNGLAPAPEMGDDPLETWREWLELHAVKIPAAEPRDG